VDALTVGLAIALLAVLMAEFVNGWTDAPNAIATVVSTGVMTPRQGIAHGDALHPKCKKGYDVSGDHKSVKKN
jgi:hypothetical protein